ncbi:MAG TPA: glycolate oxidase subunit GlcF [Steroidobacteraceae bacterium]|jgi:glycolate oxidase iron-sulfur subunit
MQTQLSPQFSDTPEGEEAAAILRKCVHCGFCNATCPTYQLLGDELDGPRGRIYLIKQVLEGGEVTRSTQQHLDRCLTCLNCQTTCPSGVAYGRLVEIGRNLVEARVERPVPEKAVRWLLKEGMTSRLFGPALRLGQIVRPLLPQRLRDKIPRQSDVVPRPPAKSSSDAKLRGTVLMLPGCVQPSMFPNIDRAAVRVLARAGIKVIQAAGTGCCGALRTHLSDHDGGLQDMRRNIDAWDSLLAPGDIQAIISSATACSLSIKEYPRALGHDPKYAHKAARIGALARDLSELLPELAPILKPRLRPVADERIAFHAPCTLQHGQGLRGGVEAHLRALGFNIAPECDESHLCCGSAGAYSVLQPKLAAQLRDRKLANLAAREPQLILSANVGCIQHLQSGTGIPVKHWIEFLDEALE